MKTPLKNIEQIQQQVSSILEGGDILFIVPPFSLREYASLGVHILQAIAKEKHFKADVLYINMVLASLMGNEKYDSISSYPYEQRWLKLGERLFARSAHQLPPLGNNLERDSLTFPGTGEKEYPGQHPQAGSPYVDIDYLLELESTCTNFIESIIPVIAAKNYKIVGCTTSLEQNNCCIAILNKIKTHHPQTLTITGGANCSGEMSEGLAGLTDKIDYIFQGESENSFASFLDSYTAGELPQNRIITGHPITDLDELPLPVYDNFFQQLEQFQESNKLQQKVIAYETSRGCWWGQTQRCSFCGCNDDNTQVFRQKTAAKALSDLQHLGSSYPATGILMTDSIVPPKFHKKLFPFMALQQNFPDIWYQENINLDLQKLLNMKKAHIRSVLVGIETLSNSLLQLMNKRITVQQNILLLRDALSLGVRVGWHMLWGFPGDKISSYEEILELLPLIRHFEPPRELIHLKLVRFSAYQQNPQAYSIKNLRPLDVYHHIYPGTAAIDKLAYEFSAEYPCESHDYPGIITALQKAITNWQDTWKKINLHLLPYNDLYIIRDSRGVSGTQKIHLIEPRQAAGIMQYGPYTGSEEQKQAVSAKLSVIIDNQYVPLVTASPDVLLSLQTSQKNSE